MHDQFMQQALCLAEQGRYTTSPNPRVGCVIVRDNQVVAQGWHQRAGEAHAEVHALNNLIATSESATAYVTLEPCCHVGRTPPCTNALLTAGIKKVVVGSLDPNPLVAGKGIAALRAAGVEVIVGVCEQQCQDLNRHFFHCTQQKKPYVIAKWAMSIDGKMATQIGDSKWITGKAAREDGHTVRREVDAILIGANTARLDNPQLTVRLPMLDIPDEEQPIRIVLDGTQALPKNLQLFSDNLPGQTWLASEIMRHKKYSLVELLAELGQREITSLLIEGGAKTLTAFLAAQLVDEIHCYVAPVFIGGSTAPAPFLDQGILHMVNAQRFDLISVQHYEQDVKMVYYKKEVKHV